MSSIFKDRRQISPPPCVRLRIFDSATEEEFDVESINSSFFVVLVELWSEDKKRNFSLAQANHSYGNGGYRNASPSASRNSSSSRDGSSLHSSSTSCSSLNTHHELNVDTPSSSISSNSKGEQHHVSRETTYMQPLDQHPPTRNLIGSLTTTAFKLKDLEQTLGIWFILHDLSIRSEGVFRLKCNFIDLSSPSGSEPLDKGAAPVICTCFSNSFEVFSAKKFPGVIDSTQLSKCFASQGIKIPTRREQKNKNRHHAT